MAVHFQQDLCKDAFHQLILEASMAVMWKAEDKYGRHSMKARDESWCGLSTLSGVLPRAVARLSSGNSEASYAAMADLIYHLHLLD